MGSVNNAQARSPAASPSSTVLDRVAALLEVVIAFVVVHVSYRSFKRFTGMGRLEGAAGLNFSTGATMILFTIAVLVFFRRSFDEYGLTSKGWRYSVKVGVLWALLTIAASAAIMALSPIRFDPITPPDMRRGLVGSAGELTMTLWLAWFLMREREFLRRVPVWVGLAIMAGLLALPMILAWWSHRSVLLVFLTVLWLFVGAGFGEEVFFRGYIQSRVNRAFGRPYRFMGIDFGLGLFVSSFLFGFVHALNTVDYFHGRRDFSWWWLLFNFVAGLYFGCMRERTGSVVAGGVQHGLFDVLARVPLLL